MENKNKLYERVADDLLNHFVIGWGTDACLEFLNNNGYTYQEMIDLGFNQEDVLKCKNLLFNMCEKFDDYLEVIDFEPVIVLNKTENKFKLKLIDHQGGNLGNIEAEEFNSPAQVIDRLEIYNEDYFYKDFFDLARENNIDPEELSLEEISEELKNKNVKYSPFIDLIVNAKYFLSGMKTYLDYSIYYLNKDCKIEYQSDMEK